MNAFPATSRGALAPPDPIAGAGIEHWLLDPSITFLNHGCFGARPRAVVEAQDAYRRRFEARPVEVLDRQRGELIDDAKRVVGGLLGMRPADFGFVTNTTGAVNAVLRSLRLGPGDELLTTAHVYNAVRQTLRMIAEHTGASWRAVDLPLPLHGPDQIVQAIDDAIGPRTRLLIIDHVTSPTAVLMPVQRIVQCCADRGIDVLIDGAHAPGMLEVDVAALGAAWYAANLHKWICAPVGAAFLWAREDRQAGIHPTTISHFLGEGLAAELSWQGTRDISPWLAAAAAIEWFDQLGWPRVREHNHRMATWVQQMLCERWGVTPATPLDGSMIGSMATFEVPAAVRERYADPADLQRMLREHHRIEVPVIDWDGRWWIRPSCQVYNTAGQYEALQNAFRR